MTTWLEHQVQRRHLDISSAPTPGMPADFISAPQQDLEQEASDHEI